MSTNSISITPDERTARNRANAAHSTGPKTEAGKQHSCLNALRHGLTGHTIILPKEDLDETFIRRQDRLKAAAA